MKGRGTGPLGPALVGNDGVDNVIRTEGGSPGSHQVFPFGSRI